MTLPSERFTAAALAALLFAVLVAAIEPAAPVAGAAYRTEAASSPLGATDEGRRETAAAWNAVFRGLRLPTVVSGGGEPVALPTAAHPLPVPSIATRAVTGTPAQIHSAASGQFSRRVPTGPPSA